MKLSPGDDAALRKAATRSAMVAIVCELDALLEAPGQRLFCSDATIRLLNTACDATGERTVKKSVVIYSRRVAALGAAMAWQMPEAEA